MRKLVKRGFYLFQRNAVRMRMLFPLRDASYPRRFAVFLLHSLSCAKSEMAVSPKRFREQLAALRAAGYRCLDFREVLEAVQGNTLLGQLAFALTFDDGYRSVFEEGLRILEEMQMTATVFVTVNFLDKKIAPPWHSDHPTLVREYARHASQFQPLEWAQLQEMVQSQRIRVGSHSMNHYLMGRLDQETLRTELRASKEILEDRLGIAVPLFSYPFGVRSYGAYSEATEEAVREAGYLASYTAETGRVQTGMGAYLLPRILLVDMDTGEDALAKAAGAYDWVGLAQRGFQSIFPNPHGC